MTPFERRIAGKTGFSSRCKFLPKWCSPRMKKDDTVTVIDGNTLEAIKTVKVAQRPRGVILSKEEKWLLICASDNNTAQVYDARTMEFVKSLADHGSIGQTLSRKRDHCQ